MKLAFVIQDRIQTTDNVAAALRLRGHDVDELVYCPGGALDFVIRRSGDTTEMRMGDRVVHPGNYAAALCWCWGTARAASTIMSCFEDAGVPILAPTRLTRVADSKVATARLFADHGIATPPTVVFDRGEPFAADRVARLDGPPFVFKFDYGTRGQGVRMCSTIDDLNSLAALKVAKQHGFVIQSCVRDRAGSVSAYRVMVIADHVIPKTITRAPSPPIDTWGSHPTGFLQVLDTPDDLAQLARQATRLVGLEVCGVDLVRGKEDEPLVLECNDGPGTDRFDDHGIPVSQLAADAFLALAERVT